MSIPVRIEIPGMVKLDDEPYGLLRDAFDRSRLSHPENSRPLKLNLDLTQAHDVAVQLEEQGFGYGAFWCSKPTIREALGILWRAIRGTEMRTKETSSMQPWAERVYYKYDSDARKPSEKPAVLPPIKPGDRIQWCGQEVEVIKASDAEGRFVRWPLRPVAQSGELNED